jgi:hypothetical protein
MPTLEIGLEQYPPNFLLAPSDAARITFLQVVALHHSPPVLHGKGDNGLSTFPFAVSFFTVG